ncbi:hypothetical protein [Deinococcus hopiensis]|uniref:Uncharacterized protein n=1 Tax=Deinococcus hopiensis KR-140 TaxID=695939 RepID=A0A1W1V9W8_9DEIO|nr:hypothetical protein [Deinococcus hopiensis]SMB90257.1 hypothetical protein SAMN00790413_00699 [Deinococcus hopiensis KR-140]
MHELSCTWVPGTINLVRLKVSGRTLELTSTRLARIFGPQALNDLYLKGRAVLKADSEQLALLA